MAAAASSSELPQSPALPKSMLVLLFCVSAAQNMTTSLLTLLFSTSLEPQQTAYFWLFMSWVYWFSPVSGWVSDVCGNRKALLFVGMFCNVVSWCLIWAEAYGFREFVIFGALQNASMLFVNSAINGALVEVAQEHKRTTTTETTPSSNALSAPLLVDGANIENEGTESDQSENSQSAVTLTHVTPPPTKTLKQSGKTQSVAMLARSLGSVIGAAVQTFLLVKLDIRDALVVSIAVYAFAAVAAVFAEFLPKNASSLSSQQRAAASGPDVESFCTRIQSLFIRIRQLCDHRRAKTQRSAAIDVVILLVFIFCNNMLPDATTFYSSYVFDAFSFPNWFNSSFQFGNLLGAVVACEVYRRWLSPLSQTKVFAAGCACAALSYTTGVAFCTGFTRDVMHVSNPVFLMIDSFCVGFLNRLAFLPVLHVASSRCPAGFEAVVFELFSLAAMAGATVSYLVTIRIADALSISRKSWDHLWILMLISAGSRALPLLVVPHLPPPDDAALLVDAGVAENAGENGAAIQEQ